MPVLHTGSRADKVVEIKIGHNIIIAITSLIFIKTFQKFFMKVIIETNK